MTIVDQQDKVIIHESLKYNVPTCTLFLQAWLYIWPLIQVCSGKKELCVWTDHATFKTSSFPMGSLRGGIY